MNKQYNSLDKQLEFYMGEKNRYDFSNISLSQLEISDIKQFASEKRSDYGNAPIGLNIFKYIKGINNNISFEFVKFDQKNIDAILYIPNSGRDRAYIIINSNQPMVNQIFATAHEYYHYFKDYESVKKEPFICQMNSLMNIKEQRASRFAAEFLLPTAALNSDLEKLCVSISKPNIIGASLSELAAICIYLTVKYALPLKAVLYRLHEENHIKNLDEHMSNYDFIKSLLIECKLISEISILLDNKNPIQSDNEIYKSMLKTYEKGLVSMEQIESDARIIGLDMDTISSIICDESENDDEDDDDDLSDINKQLLEKWGSN